MSDVLISIEIRRSPDIVRRWWTEFPAIYENAKEQPHRIVTRSRDATHVDTVTYWRGPLGREMKIPERFTLRPDGGWDVDIALPFGLAQRDVFTLSAVPSSASSVCRCTKVPMLYCSALSSVRQQMLPAFTSAVLRYSQTLFAHRVGAC